MFLLIELVELLLIGELQLSREDVGRDSYKEAELSLDGAE